MAECIDPKTAFELITVSNKTCLGRSFNQFSGQEMMLVIRRVMDDPEIMVGIFNALKLNGVAGRLPRDMLLKMADVTVSNPRLACYFLHTFGPISEFRAAMSTGFKYVQALIQKVTLEEWQAYQERALLTLASYPEWAQLVLRPDSDFLRKTIQELPIEKQSKIKSTASLTLTSFHPT